MAETSLGKKIKEARLNKKITQRELAGDVITRNMLSQIENDLAMPSIKTLEHIAGVLERPVGYFLGDIKNNDKKEVNSFLGTLIGLYDNEKYKACIEEIDGYFEIHPKSINNGIMRNIYINCYSKYGLELESQDLLQEAKDAYLKILSFVKEHAYTEDISLFNLYSKLSEITLRLELEEDASHYDTKADEVVNRIKHERAMQKIYVKYLGGEYDSVIESLKEINVDGLSVTNKGKFFLMMGSSLVHKGKYPLAINFLQKSLDYYNDNSKVIRELLYKQLSTCYSEVEDYKKAYEYLQLSQKIHG